MERLVEGPLAEIGVRGHTAPMVNNIMAARVIDMAAAFLEKYLCQSSP